MRTQRESLSPSSDLPVPPLIDQGAAARRSWPAGGAARRPRLALFGCHPGRMSASPYDVNVKADLSGGYLREAPKRLDDALGKATASVLRIDIRRSVEQRNTDYVRAVSGGWLVVFVALGVVALVAPLPSGWGTSVVLALVVSLPLSMALLRGVFDAARNSYSRSSGPLLVAYLVCFLGMLASFQPVR